MDIKFIHELDNRNAYDAEPLSALTEQEMPAGSERNFRFRLGNVSGASYSGQIVTAGDHASRVSLSFSGRGDMFDTLLLPTLEDGKSKNLYLRLTIPETVETAESTTYIVIGTDRLQLSYTTGDTIGRDDPFPLLADNAFTEQMEGMFENKPICRFAKYDPIAKPVQPSAPTDLRYRRLCTHFDPNDTTYGYEAPVITDMRCIPVPRDITDITEWHHQEGLPYAFSDEFTVFLLPQFFAQLGGGPVWAHFHDEVHPAVSQMREDFTYQFYKRSQVLMAHQGVTYHLERIVWVQRGQELAYYRGHARVLKNPAAKNVWQYNPFSVVYEQDSDIVIRRYSCIQNESIELVPGSGTDGVT